MKIAFAALAVLLSGSARAADAGTSVFTDPNSALKAQLIHISAQAAKAQSEGARAKIRAISVPSAARPAADEDDTVYVDVNGCWERGAAGALKDVPSDVPVVKVPQVLCIHSVAVYLPAHSNPIVDVWGSLDGIEFEMKGMEAKRTTSSGAGTSFQADLFVQTVMGGVGYSRSDYSFGVGFNVPSEDTVSGVVPFGSAGWQKGVYDGASGQTQPLSFVKRS